MEKNVLSEVDQIKYLFGYKAGKVISEQVTPTTPPSSGTTSGDTKPEFATIEGVVYKLPGITDLAKLENFTSVGKPADLVKSMGIDPGWLSQYERLKQQNKGNTDINWVKADKVWNIWTATKGVLNIIAKLGITPERLKDRGVQETMMGSNYGPFLKYALEPKDEEGPVITRDNYFNKLADMVSYKMKSL